MVKKQVEYWGLHSKRVLGSTVIEAPSWATAVEGNFTLGFR